MPDSITERVGRGAAFLDEKVPGWVTSIDLSLLAMLSPCGCILGQALGVSFGDACFRLRLSPEMCEQFGFDVRPGSGGDKGFTYLDLQSAWTSLILSRQQGASNG